MQRERERESYLTLWLCTVARDLVFRQSMLYKTAEQPPPPDKEDNRGLEGKTLAVNV